MASMNFFGFQTSRGAPRQICFTGGSSLTVAILLIDKPGLTVGNTGLNSKHWLSTVEVWKTGTRCKTWIIPLETHTTRHITAPCTCWPSCVVCYSFSHNTKIMTNSFLTQVSTAAWQAGWRTDTVGWRRDWMPQEQEKQREEEKARRPTERSTKKRPKTDQ